ncbi:MAG: phospholipid transport system substrate-binding protein [Planctomycetota bacterium]|jgi:phospholipid transport system substrate-binding protein
MIVRRLIFIMVLMTSTSLLAADFTTPMGRVKDSVDRVIAVLKDKSLDREASWEKIGAIIDDGFDFRSMSQSVLATNWKKASLEERSRFTEFFSIYIEETYRSRIEAYTDEEIIYKDEVIRGNRAVVETIIRTDTVDIPINYKLKENEGEWFAYDVIVEGVSLINNYRNTFAVIVKNEGMEGLLSDIQRRIDRFKAAQEEEEEEDEDNEDDSMEEMTDS